VWANVQKPYSQEASATSTVAITELCMTEEKQGQIHMCVQELDIILNTETRDLIPCAITRVIFVFSVQKRGQSRSWILVQCFVTHVSLRRNVSELGQLEGIRETDKGFCIHSSKIGPLPRVSK